MVAPATALPLPMLTDIIAFRTLSPRQISFIAAVALFFLFGFALAGTGFGPDNVYINSPYSIAQSTGLLSLFAVFILAAFCADAVVRDRETRMEELVFTTSIGKLPFLLGGARLLGGIRGVQRFKPWVCRGALHALAGRRPHRPGPHYALHLAITRHRAANLVRRRRCSLHWRR